MPVSQYSLIKPGLAVSIVLKADQRTGRQVQGTVSQTLTRHNHPRGIKVKLADGRVGRVQQILSQISRPARSAMESNNPWADAPTQNQGSSQSYYQTTPSQQQHPQQNQQWQQPPAPPQGIRRSDTDQLLAQQGDRAEQVAN
jgi:uncharacterized repeat protein (TIGR03833 family)